MHCSQQVSYGGYFITFAEKLYTQVNVVVQVIVCLFFRDEYHTHRDICIETLNSTNFRLNTSIFPYFKSDILFTSTIA